MIDVMFEFHGMEPVPEGRGTHLVLVTLAELEEVKVEVGAALAKVAATRAIATKLLKELKTIRTGVFN